MAQKKWYSDSAPPLKIQNFEHDEGSVRAKIPVMISGEFRRLLARHRSKTLIKFCRRPKIEERIAGYVIDFSDELILLHRLDWNTFALDGYTILREDDVRKHLIFNRDSFWEVKASKKKRLKPRALSGINLSSLPEAIASAAKHFPLIHIEREKRYHDQCWIGFPLDVTAATLVLDNLDDAAVWDGPYRMKMADITRVDFGGGYERALASAAPRRPKRKARRP